MRDFLALLKPFFFPLLVPVAIGPAIHALPDPEPLPCVRMKGGAVPKPPKPVKQEKVIQAPTVQAPEPVAPTPVAPTPPPPTQLQAYADLNRQNQASKLKRMLGLNSTLLAGENSDSGSGKKTLLG